MVRRRQSRRTSLCYCWPPPRNRGTEQLNDRILTRRRQLPYPPPPVYVYLYVPDPVAVPIYCGRNRAWKNRR
jgi:hypothetical protein